MVSINTEVTFVFQVEKRFVALEFELCIEMLFLELPLVQPSSKSFTYKGSHTNTYRQPKSKDEWRINKGKKYMSLWTLVFVLTHRPSDYFASIDGEQKEFNLCKFKGCFTPEHMIVISTGEVSEKFVPAFSFVKSKNKFSIIP